MAAATGRDPPGPAEDEAPAAATAAGREGGGGGEEGEGRARGGAEAGGCYLALCARPVHFEKANAVNCVFFDEANKQVFAVRSGGATGVVVKGLEDRNPISFRMEDKGEVKCIKFSLGNKILAVQRTLKSVDFLNFIPDSPQLEYTQECKTKNANILGFCWTSSTEIVFITDQGIEFYQVLPEKRSLKLLKNQSINVNWYMYCPESSVILLSTTVLGNVLQPFYFKTSVIFDIKLKGDFDGSTTIHQFVLPPRSIQPYQIPVAGPASVTSQAPVPCKLYSSSWIVFQPDIIISASEGYLWSLQVKLEPVVNLLLDKGKLMDFLLQRKECKMVILSVCSQMLSEPERGSLSVIATVFDKLNNEYKKYLEAEQSYTMVVETGLSRSNPLLKRPVRTQAVIDQSDMYTHVLSVFTEKKEAPHKFTIAVLMEYIRSLNQFQIAVQHYLYELVIKTLVQHNLFYMLHQFLQYHVLSDSKPLACLLLSLESIYPPAHQLSLDMLKRLSTANDEIVEVLLSKHQVLAALRFIRGIGGHDSISARKFLDAAKQAEDEMLFYTIFRFFEQRNQRLRGNPSFTPGEHCEEHVTFFKQVFGEQALMKPTTF
ncbi:regulator of MON1-CCZ1 complex isoform X1 [Passer montanus]|uniref:regulator of MON1-CCZ1 complex isoform X1 n=1 Tax=Passer montanus TaxID=9160 RepID=UPI0019618A54|nr:regulator of MON1-CCZ1 complex isoform X1 [Passer montanus]